MRKKILYSLIAFAVVFLLHAVYVIWEGTQISRQWVQIESIGPLSLYFGRQYYFLGISYALGGSFAVYAFLKFLEGRRNAVAGVLGGVTLISILYFARCFLLGCCGSPMLAVYLSLFSSSFLGFTKPLTLILTMTSVVIGYFWLEKKTKTPNSCCAGNEKCNDTRVVSGNEMKTSMKVKLAVGPIIFCIILIGQLFHSVIIEGAYSGYHLPLYISYSLIFGLIGYLVIDFVTATGLLRRKIQFVKLLVLYFGLLVIVNHYLVPGSNLNFLTPEIQLALTALILMLIIISDNFLKPERDFEFVPDTRQLPQKYLRPHPFRGILEAIFRLFPLPEPVALYKVGNPNDKSSVIVTGNYELTARRVAKAIRGLNCWLLICDSRGINVWCSSLSGYFSERDIIRAIELTNLSKYVSHKRLIIPQLCAAGVDIQVIKQDTGFKAVFGPVYIEHINDFLNKNKDESELRKVRFGLSERIEMAVGSPIILTVVLALVYSFIDLSKLSFILPILYFATVVHAVIYPYRPIKRIPLWSFVYSLIAAGGIVLINPFSFNWSIWMAVTVGVGTFYLINEFEGWSPVVKYNLRSIYKGIDVPDITINEKSCIGCRLCFQVCPKGVFVIENGKAKALDRRECVNCSACYERCPADAINHSSDKSEKEKCSCLYCRVQESLKE